MAELLLLEETDSTNNVARALARQGAPHGTAVLAARQSAGRGRQGRSFLSPAGGIYLSVVLRPRVPPELLPLVTPLAAVAVCRAVRRQTGADCRIKWVNDVLLGGKKVCGILTEGEGGAAVCGIGVNLCPPEGGWPPALRDIVTALPPGADRLALARAILRELTADAAALPDTAFLEEYRARSAVLGQAVTVRDPAGDYAARAVRIDGRAGLVVALPDGGERTLRAGEISIRIGE